MNENDLQQENKKLKTATIRYKKQNKELEERVERLKNYIIDSDFAYHRAMEYVNKLKAENQHTTALQDKKPLPPTVALISIRYVETPNPTLYINDLPIHFEKTSDHAAETAKAICSFQHLQEIKARCISIDEIYDWFEYSESWENISPKERKKFKTNLYQWVYRLNEKIAKRLNGYNLFEISSDGCKFNHCLRITLDRQ